MLQEKLTWYSWCCARQIVKAGDAGCPRGVDDGCPSQCRSPEAVVYTCSYVVICAPVRYKSGALQRCSNKRANRLRRDPGVLKCCEGVAGSRTARHRSFGFSPRDKQGRGSFPTSGNCGVGAHECVWPGVGCSMWLLHGCFSWSSRNPGTSANLWRGGGSLPEIA